MEELKLCPFCGGLAELIEGKHHCWVHCKSCGKGDTLPCMNKQEATQDWNMRVARLVKVDWRENDWGVCKCGGDVYEHDIYCSQCGGKVSNPGGAEVKDA